jgi:hypothetical protein
MWKKYSNVSDLMQPVTVSQQSDGTVMKRYCKRQTETKKKRKRKKEYDENMKDIKTNCSCHTMCYITSYCWAAFFSILWSESWCLGGCWCPVFGTTQGRTIVNIRVSAKTNDGRTMTTNENYCTVPVRRYLWCWMKQVKDYRYLSAICLLKCVSLSSAKIQYIYY